MHHPFQCIASTSGFPRQLFVACGTCLLSLNIDNGKIFAALSSSHDTPDQPHGADADGPERPTKKQKTGNIAPSPPKFIKLAVTPDQRHVVAVTDDKAIRVFHQTGNGQLVQLSQRVMPKRPCAVQILPDNATILCADKFGDVYSLPLLTPKIEALDAPASEGQDIAPHIEPSFKPSASNLTVHSQRNRQALDAQMKQKKFTPRKESLQFEHKLLLGHVSMLTDMKYVVRETDGKPRGYIITADRDEHVRVSRGPPHAYVIEGFGLGHTDFISKICQVGDTDLLVSGGGDSWLGVWEWPTCRLRKRFEIVPCLPDNTLKDYPHAISGLWTMAIDAEQGKSQEQIILVACERISTLLLITYSNLAAQSTVPPVVSTVRIVNPILDVTVVGSVVIVSVDSRDSNDGEEGEPLGKKRLSTFRPSLQGKAGDPLAMITIFQRGAGDAYDDAVDGLNRHVGTDDGFSEIGLDNFLYGIANLRKRSHQAGEDGLDAETGDAE